MVNLTLVFSHEMKFIINSFLMKTLPTMLSVTSSILSIYRLSIITLNQIFKLIKIFQIVEFARILYLSTGRVFIQKYAFSNQSKDLSAVI